MNKRVVALLVVLCLLAALVGCTKVKPLAKPLAATLLPSPTSGTSAKVAAPTTVPPTVAPPTAVPPSATPSPVPPTPTALASPTGTVTGPKAPKLLEPPDGTKGSVIDLKWEWERALKADEIFELQIWPNQIDAKPVPYTYTLDLKLRITSATFFPGSYRWRVIVLKGHTEKMRGEEVSPFSSELTFVLVRPSARALVTWVPSATPTASRVATAKPAATRTPHADITETRTPHGRPTATRTPILPTATRTPQGYPTLLPGTPLPTFTRGPYPGTVVPTIVPPTTVPTAVPTTAPTAEPYPVPTAVPPTAVPPTAVPPTGVPPTPVPPTAVPPTVYP